MNDLWFHIPTPGDHYSSVYGSAVITIVYAFSRVHAAHGGQTRIIVAPGTLQDRAQGAEDAGHTVEAPFGAPITRRQKTLDIALGAVGGERIFAARHYAAALEAIPHGFDGPIFVHNNPGALPLFKRVRPRAIVCLWLHNEVWRTYNRAEVRRVLSGLDRVLCVSQFIADELLARVGHAPALRDKVRVVRSGVDLQRFHPAPNWAENAAPRISYIGRVVPQKGLHLLLQAAQQLQSRGLEFQIRIIGSRQFDPRDALSSYQKRLLELAQPLGERIEFVPAVDRLQVVKEYQQTDIFCAPSTWKEPLALTIFESLACGLPTVTTRRGGLPEIGGDAALYFDPDKPGSLADVLAPLIQSAPLRADWSRKARARAETLSWENQYQGLLDAIA